MANPFTLSALATLPKGPAQSTDNLTALATGAARGLGTVNQAAALRFDNNVAPLRIKTGASGVVATGYCTIYLVTSEDGTLWTDGVDPDSTSSQAAKLLTATVVQSIATAAAATTYYFTEFSVASVLGFVPLYWAVVLANNSGAALDATAASHYAKYLEIAYA